MRRCLIALSASCLLVVAGCSQAAGNGTNHPSPSAQPATASNGADPAWQTISQLGVTYQVPASWQAGFAPGSDWCARNEVPSVPGLITPAGGEIGLDIGCPAMPGEYQVPHVKVEISEPDAALADQLGGENWERTPATKREHLTAKPAIGADEGAQEVAEEYERYRERYGPVTITVLMPADADDSELATQILDRARPATTAALGCPMVVSDGDGSDIRQTGESALTVCHYVSVAVLAESQSELGAQTQYPALLVGERQLTPAQAGEWIAALQAAKSAAPVRIPPDQAGGWEPDFIQVRSADGGVATVRYDGVGELGTQTVDTFLPLTRSTCQPLFGGLVPLMSGSERTFELCASDPTEDTSDR